MSIVCIEVMVESRPKMAMYHGMPAAGMKPPPSTDSSSDAMSVTAWRHAAARRGSSVWMRGAA